MIIFPYFLKKALDKTYDICYNSLKATKVATILSSFLLIGVRACVRQMRNARPDFRFQKKF